MDQGIAKQKWQWEEERKEAEADRRIPQYFYLTSLGVGTLDEEGCFAPESGWNAEVQAALVRDPDLLRWTGLEDAADEMRMARDVVKRRIREDCSLTDFALDLLAMRLQAELNKSGLTLAGDGVLLMGEAERGEDWADALYSFEDQY